MLKHLLDSHVQYGTIIFDPAILFPFCLLFLNFSINLLTDIEITAYSPYEAAKLTFKGTTTGQLITN